MGGVKAWNVTSSVCCGEPRICGCGLRSGITMTDSPDLWAAKRLLDLAKLRGFTFQRIASGEDAPLVGVRHSV